MFTAVFSSAIFMLGISFVYGMSGYLTNSKLNEP